MKEFRERVGYNDGSYFLLIYNGTPNDVDEDEQGEIKRKIRLFLENKAVHNDMVKNVAFIRTIFIDYDESYLYAKYHDKEKDEFVEYKDKKLTLYDCITKEQSTSKKKGKENKSPLKQKSEIQALLKNIGPIGIGPQEYKLIDIYNYFFNTHPTFGNKQISTIYQCMILILKKFNVNVIDFNDYVLDEELGIMKSPTLEDRINNLFPYGTIRSTDNDKELTDEDKKKIRIIGNKIINAIYGVDRTQALIRMTKMLYANENELSNENKELIKSLTSEV